MSGDGMSGLPKPRSMMSTPRRRASTFSSSITLKTYGGRFEMRRNSTRPMVATRPLAADPGPISRRSATSVRRKECQIPQIRYATTRQGGSMRRLSRVLTPANVIACIALFVALGGTGWAGQVIGRGAVGSVQLEEQRRDVVEDRERRRDEGQARGGRRRRRRAEQDHEGRRADRGGAAEQHRHGRDRDLPGRLEGGRRRLERGPLRLPALRGPVARRRRLDGVVRDVAASVSVSAMCIAP